MIIPFFLQSAPNLQNYSPLCLKNRGKMSVKVNPFCIDCRPVK